MQPRQFIAVEMYEIPYTLFRIEREVRMAIQNTIDIVTDIIARTFLYSQSLSNLPTNWRHLSGYHDLTSKHSTCKAVW
jgi:uncharacterized protein YutE (UPF0331/DUF86 family)